MSLTSPHGIRTPAHLAPTFPFHLQLPCLLCLCQQPASSPPRGGRPLSLRDLIQMSPAQEAFPNSSKQPGAPSSVPSPHSGHFPVTAHIMLLLYLYISSVVQRGSSQHSLGSAAKLGNERSELKNTIHTSNSICRGLRSVI